MLPQFRFSRSNGSLTISAPSPRLTYDASPAPGRQERGRWWYLRQSRGHLQRLSQPSQNQNRRWLRSLRSRRSLRRLLRRLKSLPTPRRRWNWTGVGPVTCESNSSTRRWPTLSSARRSRARASSRGSWCSPRGTCSRRLHVASLRCALFPHTLRTFPVALSLNLAQACSEPTAAGASGAGGGRIMAVSSGGCFDSIHPFPATGGEEPGSRRGEAAAQPRPAS